MIHPYRTLQAAYFALRNNSADWMLLRRGDEWVDQNFGGEYGSWGIAGRSSTERLLIASYGASSQRPVIKSITGSALHFQGQEGAIGNIAVAGLRFYAFKRDPENPEFSPANGVKYSPVAISAYVTGDNFLFEDLEISHYAGGFSFQSITADNPIANVVFRRSVVHHCYNVMGHAQGMWTLWLDGLLLEDDVFYQNGWHAGLSFIKGFSAIGEWQQSTQTFTGRVPENPFAAYTFQPGDYVAINGGPSNVAGVYPILAKLSDNQLRLGSLTSADLPCVLRNDPNTPAGHQYDDCLMNSVGAKATIFNRSFYISHTANTIARNVIDADGASGGMQFRWGGIAEGNLILRAPLAIGFGHEQNGFDDPVTGAIRNNVILDARNIENSPRAMALGIGGDNVEVANNIISTNTRGGPGNVDAIYFSRVDSRYQFENINVHDNIVYKWDNNGHGSALSFRSNRGVMINYHNVHIENNIFDQARGGNVIASAYAMSPEFHFAGNRYYSTSPVNEWFLIENSMDFTGWLALLAENGAMNTAPVFPDPDRSVESYMQSIGRTPTFEAFIHEALQQQKGNYRLEFTAARVNQYIRAGFGR